MSISSSPPSEPGWYPDPKGGESQQWWNGSSWGMSEYVPGQSSTPPAQQRVDSPPSTELSRRPPEAATQTPLMQDFDSTLGLVYAHPQHMAPRSKVSTSGTSPSTWQIWVIALLPLVPFISGAFLDTLSLTLSSADTSPGAQLRVLTDPAYITFTASIWFMFIGNFFFAYSDGKKLRNRGVPYPMPWGLIFLGSLIFVFGRTSNVKRYTGAGRAPLWAAIAVHLVGLGVYVLVVVRVIQEFPLAVETLQGL